MTVTETIPDLFARQAAAYGEAPLFHAKRDGQYQAISWRQAAEDVSALAGFLIGQGLARGDRVLLLSENRPEWGIADVAIQSAGAWTVPIYPTLGAPDIRVIARDCRPALCMASSPDQAQKLLEAAVHECGSRRLVVMQPGPPPWPADWTPWPEALAQGRAQHEQLQGQLAERRRQMSPESTATLLYTSGTTGEPKGVMLSHRNLLSNVAAGLQVIPISRGDLHLSFLPLCHVFERMAGWYLMLAAGASVAYAESMDTVPQNMLEVHPTVMLGVPRFFEKLYARIQEGLRQLPAPRRQLAQWALGIGRASAARRLAAQPIPAWLAVQQAMAECLVFQKLRARLGGALRFFVSGSAPLSKEIGEFFYSVGVTILEGYGLTETSPVITVNRLGSVRFGSVGEPLPGVEVRLADDGEILTRGPHVMQGYFEKPEATCAAIAEGWLRTGDIGRMDPQGYLYVTDRKKDLIKTAGGKFIAPQKLENLLVMDPAVSQAFVYGDRQPYCVALIVPNMEYLRRYAEQAGIRTASVHELVRHERVHGFYWRRVEERQRDLARFEQIKKISLLDQEFSQASGELTPTLKAKRAIIAKRYESLLASLYAIPTSPSHTDQ